jgi:hypothetical protein
LESDCASNLILKNCLNDKNRLLIHIDNNICLSVFVVTNDA